MRSFQNGVIDHEEEAKDDYQYYGDHNHQSLPGALLVFILTAPIHVIAGRQLHLAGKLRLRLVDEAAHIATANIEQYCSPQKPVLAGDHGWSFDGANLRQLRHGNGCAGWGSNRNLPQGCGTAAILLRVAHTDWKTPAAFDSNCEVRLADAFLDRVPDGANIDAVTGCCRSVDMNVDIRRAADLLRINIGCAWHSLHYLSDSP